MAYVPGTEEDDETTVETGEETPTIPGSGAAAGVATSDTPATPTQSAPQNSGAFVDTASYLAANQPQAQALGEFIGGKLEGEQEEAKGKIETGFQPYEEQVKAGTTEYDQDLIERARANPEQFIQDNDLREQFLSQRDAAYTGPEGPTGQDFYGDLEKGVFDIEQRAPQVETEKGREALLYDYTEAPTAGKIALDQLLIGADPSARARLSQAVSTIPTVRQSFEDRTAAAQQARQAAIDAATQARQGVYNQFLGEEGAIPTFESDLTTRTADMRTEAEQRAANVRNILDKLSTGSLTDRTLPTEQWMDAQWDARGLTPEVMADMGVTPDQMRDLLTTKNFLQYEGRYDPRWLGAGMGRKGEINPATLEDLTEYWAPGAPNFYDYNFEVSPYLTQQSADNIIRNETVATPEDYARYMALNQLMATNPELLTNATLGEAGTATADLTDFNYSGAQQSADDILYDRDRRMQLGKADQNLDKVHYDQAIKAKYAGNQGMYDHVWNGRLYGNTSGVESNARFIAAMRAAERQGWFTPTNPYPNFAGSGRLPNGEFPVVAF